MAIQDVLQAWARGRAIDDAPNGVKPPGWVQLIRNPGQAHHRAPILPDEEMIRIDREVSMLAIRKPNHHKAIVYAYLHHKRDGEIAKLMHGSRSWVRELRVAAEHYLEAKLE